MRGIILDASAWKSADDAHGELARVLGFGPGYGRNADALFDEMTSLPPTLLALRGARGGNADGGVRLLLRVLKDASAENPHFVLLTPAPRARVRLLLRLERAAALRRLPKGCKTT